MKDLNHSLSLEKLAMIYVFDYLAVYFFPLVLAGNWNKIKISYWYRYIL